ncbi:hypothetical protein Sjap_001840 [Stephania japonica]|uniref:Uncharacterized protein n=1 Tax=Stephania japonica TaxID=461633 RepID=A0AAP0PTM8_9MAGN
MESLSNTERFHEADERVHAVVSLIERRPTKHEQTTNNIVHPELQALSELLLCVAAWSAKVKPIYISPDKAYDGFIWRDYASYESRNKEKRTEERRLNAKHPEHWPVAQRATVLGVNSTSSSPEQEAR